jgi:hypothetical protein
MLLPLDRFPPRDQFLVLVEQLVFSADGERLAALGGDLRCASEVVLWDAHPAPERSAPP